MFMQNLDSTVIATALPTIAQSLDESPLTLNVAITCYLLSLAVFIPISGWTADRFGARRMFSLAIVVFTLGSIGCGMANSLSALVAARILQGMGGALMVPVLTVLFGYSGRMGSIQGISEMRFDEESVIPHGLIRLFSLSAQS